MFFNVGDMVNACTFSLSYPGNLPYSAEVDAILDFLQLSREEATIELPLERETGRKMGFGFATVSAERVDEILRLDGESLNGRRVKGK